MQNTENNQPKLLGWGKNSTEVYALDTYQTEGLQFYKISVDSSQPTLKLAHIDKGIILPETVKLNPSHTHLGFALESPQQAPEVFVTAVNDFQINQVSHTNTLNRHNGSMKTVNWKSVDNTLIQGLLMLPANFNEKHQYPLLVALHDDPAGNWSKRYMGGCWNVGQSIIPLCWNNLLEKGFIIFLPNPRGSNGYGKNFRLSLYEQIGHLDYQDIMTGIDFLIEKQIADKNRLSLFGWGYGGYLSAWSISQSERFKAAVAGSGITDFISYAGTSQHPSYLTDYLGKPFWQNNNLYLKRAPILQSEKIKAPLLLISGDDDATVPMSQSQELLMALKQQQKLIDFIPLKNQGHIPDNLDIIFNVVPEVERWLEKGLD